MLQLVEEFSHSTVFEKIPKEQLHIPAECVLKIVKKYSNDKELLHFRYPFLKNQYGDEDVELSIFTCGLSLVGHDKDGSILVARYGYCSDQEVNDIVTYIDSFNMKKSQLYNIHRHSAMRCVGCSINHDKTLLAFTKRDLKSERRGSEPGLEDFYYESAVTEVTGRKRTFTLNKITVDPQSVQFVCPPIKKSRVEQTDTFCFICQGKLGIYQILTYQSQSGSKIMAHPKGKEKVDQVVWYQWILHKSLIYLIEDTSKKSSGTQSYSLSCYNFSDRRGKATLAFKTPLNIKFSPGDKITAVKLGSWEENNVVLCKQHAHQNSSSFVPVTLYLLNHDIMLEFSVYLTDESVISQVVIYFDSIGDLLLVYIPGYYFQLINCSPDEEPKLGLCFTGPEFATPLPNQKTGKTVKIGSFMLEKEPMNSPEKIPNSQRVNSFLDSKSGTVYRYRFNREAILRVFQQQSKTLHVQALNLAVIHMQDSELIDEIIIQACTNNPDNTSSELFKEYLLATSYESFMRLVTGSKLCSSFLPITTLPPLKEYSKGSLNTGVIGSLEIKSFQFATKKSKVYTRYKYPTDPSVTISPRPPSRYDSAPQAYQHGTNSGPLVIASPYKAGMPRSNSVGSGLEKFGDTSASNSYSDNTVGKILGRILSNFLGSNEEEELITLPIERLPIKTLENLASDPHCSRIVESLSNFILQNLAKDLRVAKKSQCIQLAQEYRNIQEIQVNYLYESILAASVEEDNQDFKLLERLCNLHCAIEELWFPFPKNFKESITDLGYKCLKKNVFLQFVERGVFEISASFVNQQILSKNNTTQEDKKFKYLLLGKIPGEESINSLELCEDIDKDEHADFLMDYHSRKHKMNYKDAIDMESMLTADFLPLSIYLESLKIQDSTTCPEEEVVWFTKHANNMYSNTFKLSNTN